MSTGQQQQEHPRVQGQQSQVLAAYNLILQRGPDRRLSSSLCAASQRSLSAPSASAKIAFICAVLGGLAGLAAMARTESWQNGCSDGNA